MFNIVAHVSLNIHDPAKLPGQIEGHSDKRKTWSADSSSDDVKDATGGCAEEDDAEWTDDYLGMVALVL